jgi:acyl-CoA synthetase (AMP-forming)/AMP-acid ligase II
MVSCCPGSLPPRIVFFRTDALGEGKAVATANAAAASSRRIVSCGRPIGKIRVAVVDPMTCHEVADGRVGEIWVSDPCIALGYWQRKRDSEETFRACIGGSGEGPFLRTGDLGFMSDGELYVTSRMKDLIIVAGTNHYPQDIEWTVEQCHPAIRSSHVAASSVYASGEERVLIAAEVERGTIETVEAVQDVLNAVRRAIAEEHELQVCAVVILNRGSLPKTASGKIQRHACERLLRGDGDEVIARWIVEKGLDRVHFRETANG